MGTQSVELLIQDPGIGIATESQRIPILVGVSPKGGMAIETHTKPSTVVDMYGYGPLAEAAAYVLRRGGNPVRTLRVPTTVAGSVSPVVQTGTGAAMTVQTQTTVDATKVWQSDETPGPPVYVDKTADFQDAGLTDVDPWPTSEAIGDRMYAGYTQQFNEISIDIGTAGVGGTFIVKYWNGTALVAVSGLSDGSSNFTLTGPRTITWTMPSNWVAQTVNGFNLFYIVFEVAGTYSTNPVLDEGHIKINGPNDAYSFKAEVTKAGALGVARVKYTLDNWGVPGASAQYTEELLVPASGIIELTNTGLTVTFAGTLVLGDTYTFTTEAPFYTNADVTAAFDKIDLYTLPWRFAVFVGSDADAAAANTIYANIATRINTLFLAHKYVLAMSSVGREVFANTLTEFTAQSRDVSPGRGLAYTLSPLTIPGRNYARYDIHVNLAARAAVALISTDLSRFADGPLVDVIGTNEDNFLLGGVIDDAKFSSMRTWPGFQGVFVENVRMRSPVPGSDFRYWQHAMVMRIACQTVFERMVKYLSAGLRTIAGGKLDAADASDINKDVNQGLSLALLEPFNAEGTRGHVSAVDWAIDETTNILSTETLEGDLGIQPLAYPKKIKVRLGYRIINPS